MYSLQLRRGIARGRIWQTSALYQSSQGGPDDVGFSYGQQPVQTREFHGSRRLCEDEKKKDEDETPKPRVIPKMNFAELMKKAASLRQSVFKKPPEASATFNPAAAAAAAAAATPTPPPPPPPTAAQTAPPSSPQTVYNNANNQYPTTATTTTQARQPQTDPRVTFTNVGATPRIRRFGINSEIPTDLISSTAQQQQQHEQAGRDRRRLNRQRARSSQDPQQQQQQPQSSYSSRRPEEEPQPLTISDREAQAQDRAFSQAGAFVKGYSGAPAPPGYTTGNTSGGGFTIKRVDSTAQQQHSMTFQERLKLARLARGVSPELAGERRQRDQEHQRAFEDDGDGGGEGVVQRQQRYNQQQGQPRITALPVRTGPLILPRGARTSRAQGPRGVAGAGGVGFGDGGGRGGGGGGGRGGRGRGRGGRRKGNNAANREAERRKAEQFDLEWMQLTGNPKPAPPGTIEPHPVYDSTKPYFPDVGDLSRWIPAMGVGNSVAAKKLQWVGKPKSEKMLGYAGKALLGDGILVPGEVWKYSKFGKEGGSVTGEVERVLSLAEAGLMKNPTFGDRNQAKFLEVVRGKVGLGEARV